MWRAYQRGEIDPATLARERFGRLLGEMGRDAADGGALGASPGETAYVGDDAHADGGAAQAAGVRFWWIDRGKGGPPPAVMDQRLTSVRGVAALLAPPDPA